MSLSRSFGTCTNDTCFICFSLSCSTLFLSSIRTIYECHRVYRAHRKSMQNFGAPPTFTPSSAPQNWARMQHRRLLDTPPCVFPLLLLFFSSSSSAVSPVDTPQWTLSRTSEEKMEGGGFDLFAFEGTVAWAQFTCS